MRQAQDLAQMMGHIPILDDIGERLDNSVREAQRLGADPEWGSAVCKLATLNVKSGLRAAPHPELQKKGADYFYKFAEMCGWYKPDGNNATDEAKREFILDWQKAENSYASANVSDIDNARETLDKTIGRLEDNAEKIGFDAEQIKPGIYHHVALGIAKNLLGYCLTSLENEKKQDGSRPPFQYPSFDNMIAIFDVLPEEINDLAKKAGLEGENMDRLNTLINKSVVAARDYMAAAVENGIKDDIYETRDVIKTLKHFSLRYIKQLGETRDNIDNYIEDFSKRYGEKRRNGEIEYEDEPLFRNPQERKEWEKLRNKELLSPFKKTAVFMGKLALLGSIAFAAYKTPQIAEALYNYFSK